MLLIVLLIVYLNKTSQVAVGGEALEERVFEITSEDKLNIKLAQAVGVSHLAVSYPQVKPLTRNIFFLSSLSELLETGHYFFIKEVQYILMQLQIY